MTDNKPYPGRHIRGQMKPTAADVKKALIYNPETGEFTRRDCGKRIGRKSWCGYIEIDVSGRPFKAHRVAWLYMTGAWPIGNIDHKDGDRTNNQFANLREATTAQNSFNAIPRRAKKSDLPRGVRRGHKSMAFQAEISLRGKKIHLGSFKTLEEASEAYKKAAESLHGEFAYHLSRARGNEGATQ